MVFVKEDYYGTNEPTTSIVIGNNGAGKSFILMVIAELFDALDNRKNLASLKYEYYDLSFNHDSNEYRVKILNKNPTGYKNDIKIPIEEVIIPKKVLAVSYMLNDKFKFKVSNNSIYQYLGIRLTSNSSYTSTITNKVFDNLFGLMTDKHLFNIMANLSDFLNIDSKITFIITPTTKRFFTYKKSISMIQNRIEKYKDYYRYDQLSKLNESEIEKIMKFLDRVRDENKYTLENEIQIYKFSITSKDSNDSIMQLVDEYNVIKQLRNLGYIKSTDLILYKNDVAYPFEDASSGEKHFIYEMVSIASNIEDNTLILVDEPEISMHPNWQMKYIGTLKRVFNNFASAHFIIATHSHYLVSDLNPESSSLISIDYNPLTKERKSELLRYSTYAWSAENVLYNIFGVRTARNYYFEMDMRDLLNIVSKKDYEQLEYAKELIKKLKRYVYDDKDPLCKIISAAEELVDNDTAN